MHETLKMARMAPISAGGRYCMGCNHRREHSANRTRVSVENVLRQLYSVIGAVFLFKYGDFLFLTYPEWSVQAQTDMRNC